MALAECLVSDSLGQCRRCVHADTQAAPWHATLNACAIGHDRLTTITILPGGTRYDVPQDQQAAAIACPRGPSRDA